MVGAAAAVKKAAAAKRKAAKAAAGDKPKRPPGPYMVRPPAAAHGSTGAQGGAHAISQGHEGGGTCNITWARGGGHMRYHGVRVSDS